MSRPAARIRLARLLEGRGLEIGALNRPTPVPGATTVVYSDWLSAEAVDRLYPGSTRPDIQSDSESFPTVSDATFDFLIANHVLEHVTDPFGALCEWHRIIRPGGLVLLALPDKRYTFDRGRPRTRLSHLIGDHRDPLPPRLKNLPHLLEWATYVEKLPPHSPEWARWIEDQAAADFSVHNHVWVVQDVLKLLLFAYRHLEVAFALVRWSNTRIRGDEFVLLLRARRGPSPAVRAGDLLRLRLALAAAWAQNPLQVLQAAAKTAYRKGRADRGTPSPSTSEGSVPGPSLRRL